MFERNVDIELSSPYSYIQEEEDNHQREIQQQQEPIELFNTHYTNNNTIGLELSSTHDFQYDHNDRNNNNSKINNGTSSHTHYTWKDMFNIILKKMKELHQKETLLVEVVIVILLAKIYPRIGVEFVFPEITAHWIAVMAIFFFSGFGLKLEELNNAASNWRFISFVILFNFLFISSIVNYSAKYFYANDLVSEDLMKGMIICSCLCMPTNLMIVLTISSNGDEAVALFAATVMTLMSVFVTPVLIFWYLHEEAEVDLQKTYKTIALRVLLPVTMGIFLRLKVPGAEAFADERKKLFLTIREKCLIFVVYCTFCKTFTDETDSTRSQIIMMAICQIILLIFVMYIAWVVLFTLYNREPRLRVVGLFGCVTKTTALGIPLISAIYEDNPKLGMYTLPLLIWYPAQLIIGTLLAPRLAKFVMYKDMKYEMERRAKEERIQSNRSHVDMNTISFSLDGFCRPVIQSNQMNDYSLSNIECDARVKNHV